jgi:hypothetical protein
MRSHGNIKRVPARFQLGFGGLALALLGLPHCKALLSAAEMWRKLAVYPDAAEVISRHHIAGFRRASAAGKKLIRH